MKYVMCEGKLHSFAKKAFKGWHMDFANVCKALWLLVCYITFDLLFLFAGGRKKTKYIPIKLHRRINKEPK